MGALSNPVPKEATPEDEKLDQVEQERASDEGMKDAFEEVQEDEADKAK